MLASSKQYLSSFKSKTQDVKDKVDEKFEWQLAIAFFFVLLTFILLMVCTTQTKEAWWKDSVYGVKMGTLEVTDSGEVYSIADFPAGPGGDAGALASSGRATFVFCVMGVLCCLFSLILTVARGLRVGPEQLKQPIVNTLCFAFSLFVLLIEGITLLQFGLIVQNDIDSDFYDFSMDSAFKCLIAAEVFALISTGIYGATIWKDRNFEKVDH